MCTVLEIKQSVPILEDLPMGVLITDIEGKIEYVNDYLLEINGYSREELLGKNPSILQTGTHSKIFYSAMWDKILKGEIFKGEINNKRKNGEHFWQRVVIQPFKEEGKVTNFVAYIDDITEPRFESLLLESMVSNSYDTHLLWDKDRVCFKAYPSTSVGDVKARYYKSLIGHRIEEVEGSIDVLTQDQIEDHYRLFDEIDENCTNGDCLAVVGSTFRVTEPDGRNIILQVLMQRFNSNKFYQTIRDVTDFYEQESDAMEVLAEAIDVRYKLNHNIRKEISGKESRTFSNKNLK